MASRVSLVEVISAGVQLRSSEATALVVELCRQYADGTIRGIPSEHVVRLTIDGNVIVEGPIDTKDSPVRRAAELLETLLPGFDAAPEYHVPGALRLAIARGLGALDLPPFSSLNEFCTAIFRFAESDARQVARNLYESWRTAATMSVSDVRRARRATRMPLQRVAARSGVPLVRLRELEWGYLRNWSVDDESRAWLGRYARVVGLDEQVVIDAVWPLIEAAASGPAIEILPPAPHEMALTPVAAPRRRGRRAWQWVAAAAVAAAIALAPAFWPHLHPRTGPASADASVPPAETQPVAIADVETSAQPVSAPAIVPASYMPSAANLGTAAFVRENGSEAVLRITKVNDEGAADFDARPSPDGAHVAFDSNRDGTRAVFVADADGGNVRRISGDGFAAMASWSPDGDRLVYVKAEPGDPEVWNLWQADLATATEQRLTDYTTGQSWGGSWFPDGRHIAFGRDNTIVVLDIVTRQRRVLDALPDEHRVRTLAVSPNGRRIVFSAENDGAWLIDAASGSARRILNDPTAGNFAWGPDGRRIAFQSDRTGGWNVCILGQ